MIQLTLRTKVMLMISMIFLVLFTKHAGAGQSELNALRGALKNSFIREFDPELQQEYRDLIDNIFNELLDHPEIGETLLPLLPQERLEFDRALNVLLTTKAEENESVIINLSSEEPLITVPGGLGSTDQTIADNDLYNMLIDQAGNINAILFRGYSNAEMIILRSGEELETQCVYAIEYLPVRLNGVDPESNSEVSEELQIERARNSGNGYFTLARLSPRTTEEGIVWETTNEVDLIYLNNNPEITEFINSCVTELARISERNQFIEPAINLR